MGNIFNSDFREFLTSLHNNDVRYVFDMTEENFLEHPFWDVFTFGVPPVAIDLMISMEGFNFSDIYMRSVIFKDDGFEVRVIHKNDLIALKKKAGRSKDLDDLENLKF